ncbi:MAG TPA: class I SAM-dependent methyltransferase [Candidatus Acidoferrales bacterium]|nr:class I SAM-dependent methyltransferase [Candidatus Acidoferrales bacterium]
MEEDDLCSTPSGASLFRSERQADIVEALTDLSKPLRVLDFGSGKARTLSLLLERHPQLIPHVFDVSENYREHWQQFVPPTQQASFSMPESWSQSFDLVLSFFALEHVERPAAFAAALRKLLRIGGRVILFVPDMYSNISDMIVVDHVNHFSHQSLDHVFREAGFTDIAIDSSTQPGWSIVQAQNDRGGLSTSTHSFPDQREAAREIADRWTQLGERVRALEVAHPARGRSAIYGSGVYGLFLATSMSEPTSLGCFLDRNPFRQGLRFFDVPVIDAADVPDTIEMVYVGINPLFARGAVAQCAALARRHREYFFV